VAPVDAPPEAPEFATAITLLAIGAPDVCIIAMYDENPAATDVDAFPIFPIAKLI
jgi:hypothetical protein